jgi:SHS2 domain-containing protein
LTKKWGDALQPFQLAGGSSIGIEAPGVNEPLRCAFLCVYASGSMNGSDHPAAEESGAPAWLQSLDHTADTGIVVFGPTLPELFARAAWGMFWVIADPAQVRCEAEERVCVEAPDREALLVQWLSELNYRHVTRHLVFGRFEVSAWTPQRLRACARGEMIDASRHTIHTEIKAVTFHGLEIRPERESWRAQIIFDL